MTTQTTARKVGYFSKETPLSPFGQRIVRNGRKAAKAAISKHKAMGNPIYYVEKEILVKELADGTRYAVKVSKAEIHHLYQL